MGTPGPLREEHGAAAHLGEAPKRDLVVGHVFQGETSDSAGDTCEPSAEEGPGGGRAQLRVEFIVHRSLISPGPQLTALHHQPQGESSQMSVDAPSPDSGVTLPDSSFY